MKLISTALAAAAAELSNVYKSSTNPHFKSHFAPLDEVLLQVRPLLARHGISVIQGAHLLEGGLWSLRTTLAHTSGELMTTDYPLQPAKADPQGWAAATTYARRYALMAAVGIAGTDEDDDGNAASGTQAAPQPRTVTSGPARAVPSDLQKAWDRAKASDPKRAFEILKTAACVELRALNEVPADKHAACIKALNEFAGVAS